MKSVVAITQRLGFKLRTEWGALGVRVAFVPLVGFKHVVDYSYLASPLIFTK